MKPKSPFTGRWRIVSMSAWENDYLDEEVQAFIEFNDKGTGEFHFGYVQGVINQFTTKRRRIPAVDFSWEGGDGADGTLWTGGGWAILQDDKLHGMIRIHQGDVSEFIAERAKASKRTKRK